MESKKILKEAPSAVDELAARLADVHVDRVALRGGPPRHRTHRLALQAQVGLQAMTTCAGRTRHPSSDHSSLS